MTIFPIWRSCPLLSILENMWNISVVKNYPRLRCLPYSAISIVNFKACKAIEQEKNSIYELTCGDDGLLTFNWVEQLVLSYSLANIYIMASIYATLFMG